MFELYILLSDRCNFACDHCLNSSGAKASRWNISSTEIQSLVTLINEHSSIKQVHFTGGEPTLRLDAIRDIQQRVARPVRYVMTSNGSFMGTDRNPFGKVHLDELVLSYDKYHQAFMAPQAILAVIEEAGRRSVPVVINSVFEGLKDLADQALFVEKKVPVFPTRKIFAGRARTSQGDASWRDERSITQTCPSLEPAQRRNDLEKVMFIPGKGFTPCCGPLLFDELLGGEQLFSETFAEYVRNPLRSRLSSGSFERQASSCGLNFQSLQIQNACEACAHLYGSLGPSCPSVADLVQQQSDTAYYQLSSRLPDSAEQLLLQRFLVAYLYTLSIQDVQKVSMVAGDTQAPNNIDVEIVCETTRKHAVDFMISNYYTQFPAYYSEKDMAMYREIGLYYLSLTKTAVIYRKEGRIIGALFAHRYNPHPALNENTLHVGYWGYDRAQTSKEEARWMKSHWLRSLVDWGNGQLSVDVSIDCFNHAALKLVQTLDFQMRCLRLDKKVSS